MEKAIEKIVQHGPLAAEKMGAAGNVQKEPVGAVERHQRRIAVAPVGEAIEQPPVGLGLGFDNFDRGMHGACFRNAHADPELQLPSPRVERGDAPCVVLQWLKISGGADAMPRQRQAFPNRCLNSRSAGRYGNHSDKILCGALPSFAKGIIVPLQRERGGN